MTVKELIEKLKEFDEDLDVMYEDFEVGPCHIAEVKINELDFSKDIYVSLE